MTSDSSCRRKIFFVRMSATPPTMRAGLGTPLSLATGSKDARVREVLPAVGRRRHMPRKKRLSQLQESRDVPGTGREKSGGRREVLPHAPRTAPNLVLRCGDHRAFGVFPSRPGMLPSPLSSGPAWTFRRGANVRGRRGKERYAESDHPWLTKRVMRMTSSHCGSRMSARSTSTQSIRATASHLRLDDVRVGFLQADNGDPPPASRRRAGLLLPLREVLHSRLASCWLGCCRRRRS